MLCNFFCTFVPIRVALDLQHSMGAGAVPVFCRAYLQAYMASGCNRVNITGASASLGTHKYLLKSVKMCMGI